MLKIPRHLKPVDADSLKFALAIIAFCRSLRETWEGRELSDQLFRAGTRVGANYRAACRGLSHPDFVVKMGRVVEEADETCYWLDLIRAARITTDPALQRVLGEAGELTAIFSQSQLTAKANAAAEAATQHRRLGSRSDKIPQSPNKSVNS